MSQFASQIPTGAVNGTNTNFTVALSTGSITTFEFYRNGLLQGTGDYSFSVSVSTATITTSTPPITGDILNSWLWQQ